MINWLASSELALEFCPNDGIDADDDMKLGCDTPPSGIPPDWLLVWEVLGGEDDGIPDPELVAELAPEGLSARLELIDELGPLMACAGLARSCEYFPP